MNVPFACQSPFDEWNDLRQREGCEEASVLMAYSWVYNEKRLAKDYAKFFILDMSDFELINYGSCMDTSANDTAERLLSNYYKFFNWEIKTVNMIDDITKELNDKNIMIIPLNGRKLYNSNYRGIGPERHTLVVIGYDPVKKHIITNDPGFKDGAKFGYSENVFFDAIRDYDSGDNVPVKKTEKLMIVVYPVFKD